MTVLSFKAQPEVDNSLGDNQRMKIETPFATSVYKIELADDFLTLTDSRGSVLKFTKIKNDVR